MIPQAQKIDHELYSLLKTLPYLPFYGLIRQDADQLAKQCFLFLKTRRPPIFYYSRAKAFDAPRYLSAVKQVRRQLELFDKTLLVDLYASKLDELQTRVNLIFAIQQGDDATVTKLSRDLFGEILATSDELEKEFQEMIDNANRFFQHEKPINAELFQKMCQQIFAHYGMSAWQAIIYDRPSVKINHLSSVPKIYVPQGLQLSKARAARLLTHELEVHALRSHNGARSPCQILLRGLDHYLPTEEGLAVYFQTRAQTNRPRHLPAFWDTWTTALTLEGDFASTFSKIAAARTELAAKLSEKDPEQIGQDAAWRLCVRAYRGITNTSKHGVGFLRDHIYRSGHAQINQALKEQSEDIMPWLFTGNLGLHHLDSVKKLGISPGKTPDLISREVVQAVLDAEI